MICLSCYGLGWYFLGDSSFTDGPVFSEYCLCPECFGSGIIHCCEGLQEQPELESNETTST